MGQAPTPLELRSEARRRRGPREDPSRAILEATEALLLESGYERLSIRRLAARCGYTAPTIYHHFGDKTGLLSALLNERFEDITARLRAVPRHADAALYLRDLARTFVRFTLEHPRHYQQLSLPRVETGNLLLPAAEEGRRLVEAGLRDLAAQGRLATEDLEVAFQSLWVLLHGVISAQIMRPAYPWAADLLEVAFDAWQHGLVTRGRS